MAVLALLSVVDNFAMLDQLAIFYIALDLLIVVILLGLQAADFNCFLVAVVVVFQPCVIVSVVYVRVMVCLTPLTIFVSVTVLTLFDFLGCPTVVVVVFLVVRAELVAADACSRRCYQDRLPVAALAVEFFTTVVVVCYCQIAAAERSATICLLGSAASCLRVEVCCCCCSQTEEVIEFMPEACFYSFFCAPVVVDVITLVSRL